MVRAPCQAQARGTPGSVHTRARAAPRFVLRRMLRSPAFWRHGSPLDLIDAFREVTGADTSVVATAMAEVLAARRADTALAVAASILASCT
jgi:hypothetical protein